MPSFETAARKQQAHFRNTSETISSEARAPDDEIGRRNSHLLALGCEAENLYPTVRGEEGAVRFFREREIKWRRKASSGDARGEGPTRNMASSQIACVNFLLPLVEIRGALTAFIRAIDDDVRGIVTIEHESSASPVEFEWIGTTGPLEDGASPTRGANITSVDAFMVTETGRGRRAYLLEWKYKETTRDKYLGTGNSGATRLRQYSSRYSAESSSFNGAAPIEELLYEPFYQLMRQRLLADRMVIDKELGISEAKVITVVPEDNTAYRTSLTSQPLTRRFPHLKSVSGVFCATLKRPDDAYSIVCPSLLVQAIERECGDPAADWARYQRERYGWGRSKECRIRNYKLHGERGEMPDGCEIPARAAL